MIKIKHPEQIASVARIMGAQTSVTRKTPRVDISQRATGMLVICEMDEHGKVRRYHEVETDGAVRTPYA